MAQFDVHTSPHGGIFPLLLDVQSDVLSGLVSRIVVPMVTTKRWKDRPITRLNPTVKLEDTEYLLVFQDLASIPASALGKVVGSLAHRRGELIAAVDLLFTGI
ncbi:MAG TPA: CcdB family protein [Kofleriaceae bacterium]|jgi:toxin CcdB|nr:CcdB family protein [Kofleriaceae bacterium]